MLTSLIVISTSDGAFTTIIPKGDFVPGDVDRPGVFFPGGSDPTGTGFSTAPLSVEFRPVVSTTGIESVGVSVASGPPNGNAKRPAIARTRSVATPAPTQSR